MRRIVALIALSIVGCSDRPAAPLDTGPSVDVGTHCRSDAECSDGLFCNGVERCVGDGASGDARGCAPATSTTPCASGQTCDESADRCTGSCTTADADGDGHAAITCGGDDCDDTDAHRFPGNTEVCAYDAASMMRIDSAHDEDCNAMTYANGAAGDGDHDGDGYVDAQCRNLDANGNTFRGADCADIAPAMAALPFTIPAPAADVHPTESERCNGIDDDCNGMIDDGLTFRTYYPDCDGDNFGDAHDPGTMACSADAVPACNGHLAVLDARDCDDTANLVHPGQAETCNGVDDDCNGTIDDPALADASCAVMFPGTAHGTVSCGATHACVLSCATSFADCDAMIADGCEVNLRTDSTHCGACTTACGLAATCAASTCEVIGTIDAGAVHTCALYASSGHAVCWGENNDGQLGDGTRTDRLTATPVVPPAGGAVQSFTYLSAGGHRAQLDIGTTDSSHTCAGTGTALYCWGRGTEGQLGNSGTASLSAPALVATIPQASATSTGTPVLVGVSAGSRYTIALQREPMRVSGTNVIGFQQWAFGANTGGVFGVTTPAQSSVPITTILTTSTSTSAVASVAAGDGTTCYLSSTDGRLYCVGSLASANPVPLPTGWTGIAEVATYGVAGYGPKESGDTWSAETWCARRSGASGPVYCYGNVFNGLVAGLTDAVQITVGARHACAVRATGAIACWGDDSYGTLGNGTSYPYRDLPEPDYSAMAVVGITTAVQVSAGAEHTCARLTDGSVWCWGRNDHGQLGIGSRTTTTSPARVVGL